MVDAANIETTGTTAPESTRKKALRLTGYRADAEVLASAMTADIEFFVTLDKEHFLSNKKLRKEATFMVGKPGDFLAWFRKGLTGEKLQE